jgi:hypothetical protein
MMIDDSEILFSLSQTSQVIRRLHSHVVLPWKQSAATQVHDLQIVVSVAASLLRFNVQPIIMRSQTLSTRKRFTTAHFDANERLFSGVRSNVCRQSVFKCNAFPQPGSAHTSIVFPHITFLCKRFSTAWFSTYERLFSGVRSKVTR